MQTKRLMSLLCLFSVVVLFSSVAGAAPAAPVPTLTAPPAQCPTATAAPDFFKPASPGSSVPEWQPMVGCSLAFCNRCTQDNGICQFTGGHCVCV
jgi:hypothetical protein